MSERVLLKKTHLSGNRCLLKRKEIFAKMTFLRAKESPSNRRWVEMSVIHTTRITNVASLPGCFLVGLHIFNQQTVPRENLLQIQL